ncbi:MAG: hypothetical protein DIZ80_16855 [endosymbiont of Galathealinum brachiosum]|uniref:Uncharacterized protein n=1 Tax=endosymbiont of Galathealinum brachiosum TaxID=2200906 RepID=A0A370D926_9GAMM|nr:MAG: hypothetical protein DIZ80_16855 [endosymbiont of Galathealinum brachiosum]
MICFIACFRGVFKVPRVLCFFLTVLNVTFLQAEAVEQQDRYNWEMELDPYYSSLGLYVNLTDEEIPNLGDKTEREIYQDLLLRSHKPRFLLLEFSVNPMPILGASIRHNSDYAYDKAQITNNINVIEVLTAGFEEPYAVSLFMGNMVTYGEGEQANNKGFMGYLLSYGDKHLLNNEVIDDNWFEFEWKIKGKIKKENKNLDWSFRVGGKWHDNESIADAIYVGMRRDHINVNRKWLSLLDNSGIDVFFEFDQTNFRPTQQRFLIHKNFPLKESKNIFTLTMGLIRTTDRRYQAPLVEDTSVQLVITPSIKFD